MSEKRFKNIIVIAVSIIALSLIYISIQMGKLIEAIYFIAKSIRTY